jgi:hypothetical protein
VVILHGGLGNQLFQWAFAHKLALEIADVEFLFLEYENGLSHTKNSLLNIVSNCEHGKLSSKRIPSKKVLRIFNDPIHRYNPRRYVTLQIEDFTKNPFEISERFRGNKFYYGYFQNFQIPHDLENILFEELWSNLKFFKKNPLEDMLKDTEIIHIRQGDTTTFSNMKKVGVLDFSYYDNLPKTTGKRFVITDDFKGAQKTLQGLKVDGIFGPDQVDAVSALRIMANSKRLFTANSTLSWWGAFLAQKNGAEVFIPEPFFRSTNPMPGNSFMYPEFNLLPASFMPIPQNEL